MSNFLRITINEPVQNYRDVYFYIVHTNGQLLLNGSGLQPTISINQGSYGAGGIGTLTPLGSGQYSAALAQYVVATGLDIIRSQVSASSVAHFGTIAQVNNPHFMYAAHAITLATGINHTNVYDNRERKNILTPKMTPRLP